MTITRDDLEVDATWQRAWSVADAAELATLLATYTTPLGPKRGDIILQIDISVYFQLVANNTLVQISNLARLQADNIFTSLSGLSMERSGTARVGFRNTGAGANLKQWYFQVQGVTWNIVTDDDSGGAEVSLLSMTRSGNLTLTGNISTFAGQIGFPATQNPSSNANTLDDYEEGTFSPTIVSSGGGTPTYSLQSGLYTKIGKMVLVQIAVTLSNKGTLAAGNISLGALPFTADSGFAYTFAAYNSLATNWVHIVGALNSGASAIALVGIAAAAASDLAVTIADTDLNNTSTFVCTLPYRAAA